MSSWLPYSVPIPEQAIDLTVKAKAQAPAPGFFLPNLPSLYSFLSEQTYIRNLPLSPPQLVPDERRMEFQDAPSPPSPGYAEAVQQRPFKMITAAPERRSILDTDSTYAGYRSAMLDAMRARNGGTLSVTNPRMRRTVRRTSLVLEEDNHGYKEKRARNNAAAKRSRDIRRQKEDELAIRAAFLQRKIDELETAAAALAPDICLRCQRRNI